MGLQVGDPQAEVKGILCSLDVTEEVVDEAIHLAANWIVAHHAVLFRPLSQLRTDQPLGRLLGKAMSHQIQIYIAHTNLDTAPGGVNDVLAERLSLLDLEPLDVHWREELFKLAVYVPLAEEEKVRLALGAAGAGWIGSYSDCTFRVKGVGTFLPREGTQPYIGEPGQLEQVEEVRIETIVRQRDLKQVLATMEDAHPYEEVAYDLYPLVNQGEKQGLGRVGHLSRPLTLEQLAQQIIERYQVEGLRMVGSKEKEVRRVAILGGSGANYWPQALAKGADVLITGDVGFHAAQDALAAGMALIDPGHHVEVLAIQPWADRIKQLLPQKIPVSISKVDTNPFSFM
jgi:dinuclear metal center YbgI/SA1388 family protein